MWTNAWNQRSAQMVLAPTLKDPTCVHATRATAQLQTTSTVKVSSAIRFLILFELHLKTETIRLVIYLTGLPRAHVGWSLKMNPHGG